MKIDSPRRRLSAEARRARIADAAMQVFAERGYHAASIAEIARCAGISKPVVYDHFASKADLHLQLLARERDRLLALTDAAATLQSALEAFFAYVQGHPYAWRMLFRETTGDPAVARAHERVIAEARAGIARQIARGVALSGRGARLRSELLAEGVMGVTHGLALWWQGHPDVPRREIVRAATDLLVPGLARLAAAARR
ncbi:MAG: TetR/AcrR family transcriptional regulator [Solirubrobacteraceae bacterium]|nr:MAG: TetR/AcrR family transcriptional regulator [Solirubrobacterales bacterium]